MVKSVARYLRVWGVVFICVLILGTSTKASFISPSNLLHYNNSIFAYDLDKALIKRSLDGDEYWKLDGPFQFDYVSVSHDIISLLHQDNSLHRFGAEYGDSLLTIDDSLVSFKVYLSYILYLTSDNDLVVVDSQTGFEFWRKKLINISDFFFYSAKGNVAVKQKNLLVFYSVLTGEKTGDVNLPAKKGAFFEFVNSLLFLSNNVLYELQGSNFKVSKDFSDKTTVYKIDQRYISYKSNLNNMVYVYDVVLKKEILKREIEDVRFIDISDSKLCLASKSKIKLFDFDNFEPLLDVSLNPGTDILEIRACLIKGKTLFLYSKSDIHKFKLP